MNRPLQTRLARFALLVGISLATIGCEDNLVGRICDLGETPAPGQVVIASPSLDCVSRTCLRVSSRTCGLFCRTRLTVDFDTPAACATSMIVGRRSILLPTRCRASP